MNNNVYEIGFLVNSNLSQQEAENSVEKVKTILTKKSAAVISEGEVVNIELAYQITTKINSKNEKFDDAYFSWIKFSSKNTNSLEEIKTEIDKIKSEIFRYLITKTTADNEATDKFIASLEEDEIIEDEKTVYQKNANAEEINSEISSQPSEKNENEEVLNKEKNDQITESDSKIKEEIIKEEK